MGGPLVRAGLLGCSIGLNEKGPSRHTGGAFQLAYWVFLVGGPVCFGGFVVLGG